MKDAPNSFILSYFAMVL